MPRLPSPWSYVSDAVQIAPGANYGAATMKYLTMKDLRAKLGGRGRSTIYNDVALGRLPKPFKIGTRLYWAEADIDAAIAAQNAG